MIEKDGCAPPPFFRGDFSGAGGNVASSATIQEKKAQIFGEQTQIGGETPIQLGREYV